MTDIFISYAHSTAPLARRAAEALRALGYGVWRDDELPAHRAYADVIEERLRAAKAVVVIWSVEAVKSQWVRAEADIARQAGTLVQLRVDACTLPLPFNQIQFADLAGWTGDTDAPGWDKVVASVADLIGATGGAPAPARLATLLPPGLPSIAVLAFANLSGDAEQDYFADGMVEEITTALSRIRSIFVIDGGSGLSFKDNDLSAQEIAAELGVRYILEGSVRRAANKVRIAVRLIDGQDGAQVWAERFEDTLDDIFALQDRVALSVAGKIEPTLQQAEIRRASARPTASLGSYDLYLRSLPYGAFEKSNVLASLDLLNRAIELDPGFGAALAWAGFQHRQLIANGWSLDPDADRLRGVELAERTLRAAPDDAFLVALAAQTLMGLEPDLGRPTALVERALSLNPGCAQAWFAAGHLLLRLGEPDLAIERFGAAMRLSPALTAASHTWIAVARFEQERFAEALSLFREGPHPSAATFAIRASLYGHLGLIDEARAALAHYGAIALAPAQSLAGGYFRRPEHQAIYLRGLALAQATAPS